MLSQSVQDNISKVRTQQTQISTSLFTHSVIPGQQTNYASVSKNVPIAKAPNMAASNVSSGRISVPQQIRTQMKAPHNVTMSASSNNYQSMAMSSKQSGFMSWFSSAPKYMGLASKMTPAPNAGNQIMMASQGIGMRPATIPQAYGFRSMTQNMNPRASVAMSASASETKEPLCKPPLENPIKRLMCCNRGEIAIRVFRCCKENGIRSIALYSEQDSLALHRYKADEAYEVRAPNGSPVQAYLAIDEIIEIAKRNNIDAIHPGYGFLSENHEFAQKCKDNGIIFVGPNPETITKMGDKTAARKIAKEVDVPVIPGTDAPLADADEAYDWCKENGLPVMMKAAMGGGGRGMRVVRNLEEVKEAFERCSSEATTAFGDGSVFIERLVEKPRHIEVQILADKTGNTVHLYDRDCSVQRRHQKVVEIAPASGLDPKIRQAMLDSAVKLCKSIGYKNAGTVEFLVENDGSAFYFIEVNPRVQVEHTVTEEVCGVDIVQSQIMIAGGSTLDELDIKQDAIHPSGYAIQCRVTTEDPKEGFKPDTGRIGVFRVPGGMGVRLDGMGHQGAVISPYYDSLLTKVTCKGRTFKSAAQKLYRSLDEFKVRGIKTNIQFVKNVLAHPTFYEATVDTSFIDSTPELFEFDEGSETRIQRILEFLGEMAVNGNTVLNPNAKPVVYQGGIKPAVPKAPFVDTTVPPPDGWRKVLLEEGPKGFAKAIRNHDKPLIMDTTWRDAHQSLLATRVRTNEIAQIAPLTARAIPNAFSLEMWGGATFDVSLRFLKEDPWVRLRALRKQVPNIPFQMLLRGANAVGYTSYADNTVEEFCKEAVKEGIDIFRVFDSLNYIENLKFGIKAARNAGGVVEATICYTGDVITSDKYNLDYYVDLAQQLVDEDIDVLAIKDMAGLLKPDSARLLIGTLREKHPDLPIHIHTHDTAGTGAASMLAAVEAGADIVDGAIDCLSNSTSQPALGSLDALLGADSGIIPNKDMYGKLDDYWQQARKLYAPFETGTMASATDVYMHEMPGGQVTNLRFQAEAVGLGDRWDDVKKAYAMANRVLGDIVKVTPSSKVAGDLSLFMVQNNLDENSVVERAAQLDFPDSVVDFMNGRIGVPSGGFPEEFRKGVLKGKAPAVPDGTRPGESMESYNFEEEKEKLVERTGIQFIEDLAEADAGRDVQDYHHYNDLISAALYPDVHRDFLGHITKYGDTSRLPTPYFFSGMNVGEEMNFRSKGGRPINVKLIAMGHTNEDGMKRVFFEVNGIQNSFDVEDRSNQGASNVVRREKADNTPGQVGCPMKGLVVDVLKNEGDLVSEGEPIGVLSAMKMETIISAPCNGRISKCLIKIGDALDQGDLIAIIQN